MELVLFELELPWEGALRELLFIGMGGSVNFGLALGLGPGPLLSAPDSSASESTSKLLRLSSMLMVPGSRVPVSGLLFSKERRSLERGGARSRPRLRSWYTSLRGSSRVDLDC